MTHYQRKRWHGELDTVRGRPGERIEQRTGKYAMISDCCDSDVREGDQHENGKQYCTACGEPCMWRWKKTKSTVNDANTAPPSQQ